MSLGGSANLHGQEITLEVRVVKCVNTPLGGTANLYGQERTLEVRVL